jgi:hypothetical protein
MLSAAARHTEGRAADGDSARRGDRRAAADRAEADGAARRRGAAEFGARHRRGLPPVAAAVAISLADIIEAVEGPIAMTACVEMAAMIAGSKAHAASSPTGLRSTMR